MRPTNCWLILAYKSPQLHDEQHYTGWAKKTAHGVHCNNFVFSQPIFIIFGRYKAYEICN